MIINTEGDPYPIEQVKLRDTEMSYLEFTETLDRMKAQILSDACIPAYLTVDSATGITDAQTQATEGTIPSDPSSAGYEKP